MEETAECPNAVGAFAAMAIDSPRCSVMSGATQSGGKPVGQYRHSDAVQLCIRDDETGARSTSQSDARIRPFVGRVAAKPTLDRQFEELWGSCLIPAHGRCADRGAAREDVDDDHRCAAVPADKDGPGFDDGVVR